MWDKNVPAPPRAPNFSPFPFERLPRVRRRDAAFESALARWIVARPLGDRVARIVGAPVRARLVGTGARALDPYAGLAEVRLEGLSLLVAGSSAAVRRLAQRWLGGPAELEAPRPLTAAEHAIWALAIAAAIEDTGVPAEVWPLAELDARWRTERVAVEIVVESVDKSLGERVVECVGERVDAVAAPSHLTVVVLVPRELELRAPPPRPVPAWTFDIPVIVGRCALARESLARLRVRDVIVVERGLSLAIGEGRIELRATPGAMEAEVATGYLGPDMALPDDAHVELTVQLGTTRLSLRQLAELAPGQIVSLGRPLAGPFEVRAAGRLIGRGELVDVDGELGVRIVSLEE